MVIARAVRTCIFVTRDVSKLLSSGWLKDCAP